MIILVLSAFAVWLYLISVLHRTKLSFFKFLFGSIGIFFFLMYFLEPIFMIPLAKSVCAIAGILGKISGTYEAFTEYSLIFISHKDTFISFYIDYECSGIVEILTFSSLLWFFPLYTTSEKAIVSVISIAWIFMANVIRIFVICLIIYYFGNDVFYFAHTIFGRVIFYVLSVALYFYVFTRAHVIRQKVGSFSYAKDNS